MSKIFFLFIRIFTVEGFLYYFLLAADSLLLLLFL